MTLTIFGYVIVVLTTLSVLVCAAACIMGIVCLVQEIRYFNKRTDKEVLPHPDVMTERMYDQQYFDRAIGKK